MTEPTTGIFTAGESISLGDYIEINNGRLYRMRMRVDVKLFAVAYEPMEEGDTVAIDDRGRAFVVEEEG